MNIEELKKRADVGDAEAMCDLGMAYFHGENVEQDKEKRLSYYKHRLMPAMNMLRTFWGQCT